jgi:hypothetical protein
MEERFILSMLETRYASHIAAENNIILLGGNAHEDWKFEEPLLYRNNDCIYISIS